MSWRVAHSLKTLREQVNSQYPNRGKGSDGTIGDTAHSKRKSDHNPDSAGRVNAMDLTHDPKGGFDSYAFAEHLRQTKDPRLKYVISNRRIFHAGEWVWKPYKGSNAHSGHVHISVAGGIKGDDSAQWKMPA